MESINITKARQNLYKLVKETNESHYPIQIIGKEGNAVLVSEEDWRSIQETLYLHSVPGLVEAIKESENEPVEEMVSADDLDWE
ncbi:MAG: type II toxin-antitoxin system Phd/YefM family antitoxin [Christensenellaceae bacterium]